MPEVVTAADDPRLGDYRQLRDASARRRIEGDEFFIAEGPIAIERLIASDHHVRSVLVSEPKYERLRGLLDPLAAPTLVVDRALLHEIVGFDLHRGAIAAADRRPHRSLDELVTDPSVRTIAVLEGLNDPENLGAIARSAHALGVDALVLDPTCIDPYTRRTVRVSMGEILHLSVCRTSRETWPHTIGDLRTGDVAIWALTPTDDAIDLWSLERPERLALLLGAEGPGLTHGTMRAADRTVRIPIAPDVDSLNVAAAAAVAFAIAGRRQAG